MGNEWPCRAYAGPASLSGGVVSWSGHCSLLDRPLELADRSGWEKGMVVANAQLVSVQSGCNYSPLGKKASASFLLVLIPMQTLEQLEPGTYHDPHCSLSMCGHRQSLLLEELLESECEVCHDSCFSLFLKERGYLEVYRTKAMPARERAVKEDIW